MKVERLGSAIDHARKEALRFFDGLFVPGKGFKNTVAQQSEHDVLFLNGTWACILGKRLIGGDAWVTEEQREQSLQLFNRYRNADGMIYPATLIGRRTIKSHQYLKLHCNNYAISAALELDPNYDFSSPYLDRFLDPDVLSQWLDRISFYRPWEESNNIVNVASHLALHADAGNSKGLERLGQMLDWHNRFQNPRTGGFDATPVAYKYLKQTLAGAVHNFHIHHYLNESVEYSRVINEYVCHFLVEGPLTACLSIDYTELAVRTILSEYEVNATSTALSSHIAALLESQNRDGGWYESDHGTRTSFEGYVERIPSSSSYGTWFRLCSIGMFSMTFLNSPASDWRFKRTLGMGYAPDRWPTGKILIVDSAMLKRLRDRYRIQRIKSSITNKVVSSLKRFI